MNKLWTILTPVLVLVSCAPAETGPQAAPAETPPVEVSSEQAQLGGCILTSPDGVVPDDLYQVSDIVATEEYKPFTKKLVVYGLTLIARDDVSDDFLRRVARTIQEVFPQGEGVDRALQEEVLRNHYRYKAVIPVPLGEDMSFLEEDEAAWELVESQNTICDIIMQDVPGQVMEVVEHILHYVTDTGLHYTFPDEWGISETSALRQAMDEAVAKGYYQIGSYSDLDDEPAEVRNRVLLQEFAYWVISTAWNVQEAYGPQEDEWTIKNEEDLKAKLPDFYAVYERTAGKTMAAPSLATLQEIGPTRAEERAAEGGGPA